MRQLKITKQVTNRASKSLDKYLQDVNKLPMITAEEEVALAQRIKKGDQMALNKLVTANLRFVISVAKQYQNQGLKLGDLINEGNLGLIKAAQRFDETKGFKFISYAVWWVRQSILKSIAEQSRLVRLPLNKINHISKINKAHANLELNYQRSPSEEEIAQELGVSVNVIRQSLKHSRRPISLDAPLKEDETSTLYEVIRATESPMPDRLMIKVSLQTEVERALKKLSPKEADILRSYFGIGSYDAKSLSEIAEIFDLTRERVRQVKGRAVKRLRYSSKSKILMTYLG
ncbi:sigma-70 family RNA polymerase sigma factor [Aquimarina algicola]|uniref:RNA polymerase sigma factor RpoD/SigA n=1 Tax=Aquimarina algicola TaxID=2589995 RepID=A0A504JD40_9FLAO|nr:RNA polymerase sigma factor RpoD/SigA [Aquimarina algicola]TPN84500.1 RNA polymerase sigma factor RpoD/SigA [Aquimarina algicola]